MRDQLPVDSNAVRRFGSRDLQQETACEVARQPSVLSFAGHAQQLIDDSTAFKNVVRLYVCLSVCLFVRVSVLFMDLCV